MGKNNARMTDVYSYIQAGINPKTKLPYKMDGDDGCLLKSGIQALLSIQDEQDAVNRYTWYNIPCNISSQELERLLYYRGELCFFYNPDLDNFYFMPYALDGTIDFYQRFNTVHPVPIAEGEDDDTKKLVKKQTEILSKIKLDVLYDIPLEPVNFFEGKHCVLLHDYTKQLSQKTIARSILQQPLLDIMSDCIPFMRTNLLNSTGVSGMRVGDEDEAASVEEMSQGINDAALQGRKYVGVIGKVDFQDLTGGQVAKSEEFMLALQSLNNFRLSQYGLENGGLYNKKAHVLQEEQQVNGGSSSPLQDGLAIRQRFCDIINFHTGCGIYCEVSEQALEADMNGDGLILDENDQTGSAPGEQEYTQGGAM